MSDDLDLATVHMEILTRAATQRRMEGGPAPTGFCLYCGERVPDGRWCDASHRNAWEHEKGVRNPGRRWSDK